MKIAMVGDIGLFGRHGLASGRTEKFFADVAEYLAGFDLVIGNLETPFTTTTKARAAKSAYIRSEPENVALLKRLNISAVTLANNHTLDFGDVGLAETIDTLERAGIAHYGARGRTCDISIGGQTVRLIGMCSYDTNPIGVISGRLDEFSIAAAEKAIKEAHEAGALPVLSVHFGIEHRSFPMPRHRAAFRQLAQRHRFILHGHHPHALQPAEEVNGSLLAYSLGNFCFDIVRDPRTGEEFVGMGEINRIGGILTVDFTDRGLSWELVALHDDGERLCVNDEKGSSHAASLMARYAEDHVECERFADSQRSEWVAGRRSMRDFRFWLERFRPRYFNMLAAAYVNSWLDRRKVPY